jgi:GTP-binding protein EngB required for normal cell division
VTTSAPPFAGLPSTQLPDRLAALAALVEIAQERSGPGGFRPELVADAEGLLARAGERLTLSAAHTVVTLAGGTGSGKSSLFNALAGANFSPSAVTRPATRNAHACVWGVSGAAPLLDWLGVERRYRYARASALDAGESDLGGLILLDLPDHDSVAAGAATSVERLVSLADMMVWVLDPQKYADAAVHNQFLAKLAGHAAVTTVVLNQCDLLTPQQAHDCEEDLRRLLDSEGHGEARVLLVSAVTGTGLDQLRQILAAAVSARQSTTERIAADIDSVIAKFGVYAIDAASMARTDTGPLAIAAPALTDAAGLSPDRTDPGGAAELGGPPDLDSAGAHGGGGANGDGSAGSPLAASPAAASESPARPPWETTSSLGPDADGPARTALDLVPPGPALAVADALAHAVGLAGVTDALEDVREIQAAKYLSWPFARVPGWLPGREPVRSVRLSRASADARIAVATGAEAQQSEIDSAITVFADAVSDGLPDPWPRTVRAAARSQTTGISGALSSAVSESVPAADRIPGWWRLVCAWQWLLVALVIAGIGWMGVLLVAGVFHAAGQHPPELLGSVALIPWVAAMVVAFLLLGWLTATGSQNAVTLASDREREQIAAAMRSRIDAVARDLVVIPAGTELTTYTEFCTELTAAARA